MSEVNRTNLEKLLRTVYMRDMRRQFSLKSVLLQAFRRNERNFAEGEKISVPVYMSAGEGHTWSDDDNLPPASSEKVDRAEFNYKMMSNRIQVRQSYLDAARSRQAAELDPLQFQMRSLVRNGRHDLNYDLYGDGDGSVASIASTSSSTTFTLSAAAGMRNNLRVDILKISNGAVGGGVSGARIAFNRKTLLCTMQDSAEFADGDGSTVNAAPTTYKVYRHGAYKQAMFGLGAAVLDSNPASGINYGGIDRSDDLNDAYRAIRHHNSGTPRHPSPKLMQDVLDDIEKSGGAEGEVNLILCPHDIWSSVAHELTTNKRYNGQEMRLNGWAQAVDFRGIPIVRDKHCPAGKMYFLDTGTFRIYQDSEGKWMDDDGAILSRIDGKVAYQAAWYRRLQLVCLVPSANGLLEDLQYVAPA